MGIGVFLALCTSCSLTLISMWLDEELSPYLLFIPQVLNGCSVFLTFITSFEFVVAQSPLRMQGLLIGVFVCEYLFYFVLNFLSFSVKHYLWQYYTAKTVLIFLSCLIFLVTAVKYKHRERNETTDVNDRLIIAEYHERQLLSRDEELDTSDQYIYDSIP